MCGNNGCSYKNGCHVLSLFLCAHIFSSLLSVHIGIRSELHPRIDMNSHPEKSDMSSYSGMSMKTCSVGAAFVFKSNQILLLLLALAKMAQWGI